MIATALKQLFIYDDDVRHKLIKIIQMTRRGAKPRPLRFAALERSLVADLRFATVAPI